MDAHAAAPAATDATKAATPTAGGASPARSTEGGGSMRGEPNAGRDPGTRSEHEKPKRDGSPPSGSGVSWLLQKSEKGETPGPPR